MHYREIHLDVVGTSRYIFGMGRLCFMVGFKRKSTGKLLGAYNLRVVTPRALVHAGDKTSEDVRVTPLFPTMMVQAKEEMGEGSANPTDPHHTPTIIQPSTSQPQKTKQYRKPRRKVIEVPQPSDPTEHAADEAVNKEMDDSLETATTTATSLDAEQDRGNFFKNQSKATPNEPSSQGTSSGGGPNGEDSLKLNGLMELCTKLQQRVLDLETIKTTQALEIDSLKRRVKKLERRKRSRTHRLKRLYKVGLSTRVESFKDKVTLAQALTELKHTKPKAKVKRIVFHEPEESTTTTTIPKSKSQDKGKAKMIEEPVKLKKKDQIMLDEEVELKLQAELQAEFDKEERLAREKAQKEKEEANIALIESWDDV
nr:hypothetical protein [Tanacetum cinerariifolium]GEX47674.1 hypothetical protein [Tanacetum cinerariifolium]